VFIGGGVGRSLVFALLVLHETACLALHALRLTENCALFLPLTAPVYSRVVYITVCTFCSVSVSVICDTFHEHVSALSAL